MISEVQSRLEEELQKLQVENSTVRRLQIFFMLAVFSMNLDSELLSVQLRLLDRFEFPRELWAVWESRLAT